jgi:hypothetical protein
MIEQLNALIAYADAEELNIRAFSNWQFLL